LPFHCFRHMLPPNAALGEHSFNKRFLPHLPTLGNALAKPASRQDGPAGDLESTDATISRVRRRLPKNAASRKPTSNLFSRFGTPVCMERAVKPG
jgi:hypothetical protein